MTAQILELKRDDYKAARVRRIGAMSEAVYQAIDWLASRGAYGILREIRDYINGILREESKR